MYFGITMWLDICTWVLVKFVGKSCDQVVLARFKSCMQDGHMANKGETFFCVNHDQVALAICSRTKSSSHSYHLGQFIPINFNPFQYAYTMWETLEIKLWEQQCTHPFVCVCVWDRNRDRDRDRDREKQCSLSESLLFSFFFPFQNLHSLIGDYTNTPYYLWVIFGDWLMSEMIREVIP